ncbi:MAG: GYD domain-containing protein [Candidatus Omnitrophica bacterium]|nr:GYD domain-containing protein [Candidatus Omnitrophota bacterium]
MAWYVVLANFTDQGIRAVKDTAKRAKVFRETAGAMGVKIKDIYWTLGHHDVVLTMEAPDDETAAALMMKVGALGNLTSQTLRAFTEPEIAAIVSRV